MLSATDVRTMPRGLRIAILAARALLVLTFLMAGGLKIYGLPRLVVEFQQIGLGDWFRYLTGTLEIAGAVSLMIPGAIAVGAALLGCVMIGAIATHVFIFGDSALAASVLLVLCLAVLVTYRHELTSLSRRLQRPAQNTAQGA